MTKSLEKNTFPATSLQRKLEADYYGGKLRKYLSCCSPIKLADAFWILNTARGNPGFVPPSDCDYPHKYITARMGEEGAIFGWDLETILLTAFATKKRMGQRELNPRTWKTISTLVNLQRKLEDGQSDFPSSQNILESMTRLLYRQLPWQEHDELQPSVGGRWWLLLNSPEIASIFESRNGISVKQFVRLCLCLYELFDKNTYCLKPTAISQLGMSDGEINAGFKLLSSKEEELSKNCSRETQTAKEVAYRASPLRERPLICTVRNGQTQYICPFRQLLAWRATRGLYFDVIQHSDAPRIVGKAFEEYLTRLCKKAFPDVIVKGDFTYGTKANPKHSPDIVISKDGRVLLTIECKSKRASKAVQLQLGRNKERDSAISEIAKGLVQLQNFDERLIAGDIPGLCAAENKVSLVVTLDDWIFWGDTFDKAVDSRTTSLLAATTLDYESKDCVAFCNAYDFERMVCLFSLEQILEIVPNSRKREFRTHRLWDFARSNFDPGRPERKYLLMDEVSEFLNIGEV